MTDKEIRAGILEAGYKAAKERGDIKGGIFLLHKISADWGETKEKIDFNASYLNEKGLVIRVEMGGGMQITVEGVDEYEGTRGVE